MAIVSVMANYNFFFFLLIENAIIVHYKKFPNIEVYHANFPNLKGPRAPSQNCRKKPAYRSNHMIVHLGCHSANFLFIFLVGTRCPVDFAEVPSVLMEYFASDPRVGQGRIQDF